MRVGRIAQQGGGGLVGSWMVPRGPLLPKKRVCGVQGTIPNGEGLVFGQGAAPQDLRAGNGPSGERLFERGSERLGEATGQRDFLRLQPLGWVGPDCWKWTQESAFVSSWRGNAINPAPFPPLRHPCPGSVLAVPDSLVRRAVSKFLILGPPHLKSSAPNSPKADHGHGCRK